MTVPRALPGILALVAAGLGAPAAQADPIDMIHQVLSNTETSPVPRGWLLGGAAYSGSSPYDAGDSTSTVFPGGVYLGEKFMYLGDRAFYTFAKQGAFSFFGRLRLRLGNLDPQDEDAWTGLRERKGQLEAGLGVVMTSPIGLWSARFSSDVSGRSNGTEVLLNWSVPIVRERWLLMPGVSVFWRSDKLANYYFGGVSAAEAAPGRPAYDVGSAWTLSPSVLGSYRLSDRWLLGAVASYEAFGHRMRDSPIVQKDGYYNVLVALGYVLR